MKLWFRNACGKERVIAQCNTWKEVNQAIDNFIQECNEKWMEKNPFVRYYTRLWKQKDGRTCIDVGSHTEFFIWEGEYDG